MHICYVLSNYISYRKSGLAYVECLRRLGHTVSLDLACLCGDGKAVSADGVDSTNSADSTDFIDAAQTSAAAGPVDLAILHGDPQGFPALFDLYPKLRRIRSIGYVVWETDILPKDYRDGLSLVNEVWTCSAFSCAAIAPHAPATAVVPHVVQRSPVSPQAFAAAQTLLRTATAGSNGHTASKDTAFFFLSVLDAINPRKNAADLLAVFARVRARAGRPVYLVLKQYRVDMDFSSLPGVLVIGGQLSEEAMAALYGACHAYVSAHRAEAWGLGMSEAMAWGKPVAATGYSGNMAYMTAENSFPLPYRLVPVSKEMVRRHPQFSTDMRWAQVDTEAMEQAMLRILRGRYPDDLPLRAAEVARRFSIDAVTERIRTLL